MQIKTEKYPKIVQRFRRSCLSQAQRDTPFLKYLSHKQIVNKSQRRALLIPTFAHPSTYRVFLDLPRVHVRVAIGHCTQLLRAQCIIAELTLRAANVEPGAVPRLNTLGGAKFGTLAIVRVEPLRVVDGVDTARLIMFVHVLFPELVRKGHDSSALDNCSFSRHHSIERLVAMFAIFSAFAVDCIVRGRAGNQRLGEQSFVAVGHDGFAVRFRGALPGNIALVYAGALTSSAVFCRECSDNIG